MGSAVAKARQQEIKLKAMREPFPAGDIRQREGMTNYTPNRGLR